MKKITILDILNTALMISILCIAKILENTVPKMGGISTVELWVPFLIAAIYLMNVNSTILVLVITPFVWYLMGSVWMVGPMSFFMDYSLSMFIFLPIVFIPKTKTLLSLNKLILMSIFVISIKTLIQTWSGVVNWNANWHDSFYINIWPNLITMATTVAMMIVLFRPLSTLYSARTRQPDVADLFREYKDNKPLIFHYKLIHEGYTNKSYKVYTYKQNYQFRIPKFSMVDWSKEMKIYKALNPEAQIFENGYMIKPWIDGYHKDNLNNKEVQSLFEEIENLHKANIDIKDKWDWHKYDKHLEKLSDVNKIAYDGLIQKYKKDKYVLSHTDLNKKNILIKNNKVTLIDFEWLTYAPEYLDYAVVKHTMKINNEKLNQNKLKDYEFMFVIFSYLWTFEMKETPRVLGLRKNLENMLK